MDNYEKKCKELDIELAALLGTPVFIDEETGHMWYEGDIYYTQELKRWTQNDAEAFRLAVEQEINWHLSRDYDEIVTNYGVKLDTQDFTSDLAVVRYAIVQAVINKLKASHG